MDNSQFNAQRDAIKSLIDDEQFEVQKEERYVRWYQNVAVLEAEAATKALIYGSLLGLSEMYMSKGLFAETIAVLRKAETLFFELLDETDAIEPYFVMMIVNGYSSHGLDGDAQRVAQKSLERIKSKFASTGMTKTNIAKFIKPFKDDLNFIIKERRKRRAQSLAFIESLATAIPECEYRDDWLKVARLGHCEIAMDGTTRRQFFEEQFVVSHSN